MKRVDFLMSILFSVILIKMHLLGYGWPFYVSIVLLILCSLIAWLSEIQISYLKKTCNIGDDSFSEKYKGL